MKSATPKVLHAICGQPMISYVLRLVAMVGAKQPIVVLGYGADQVKARLPKEVKVAVQHKQQGTGDAVKVAKKHLGSTTGDVLVLYGDAPLLRRTTIQRLLEAHSKAKATCTVLTAHLADSSGYGRILRNENGQGVGVVEESNANAATRAIREINVGPLVVDARALEAALAEIEPSGAKKELYLTKIIAHIAQQEGTRIHAIRVEEVAEALGVNSRTDLAKAISVIRQRLVAAHLKNGVTIEDPNSAFIDLGVSIGHDTTIRPYTVIETGVTIGRRCTIGPFARLRTGVTVSDDTRIGNFVELVRTKIGPRVRINHMAYLGDALVDEEVNIGAGTITANYDGQEKHQTQIGRNAFIGCDTVLIAPVKIGPRAVTGAGSVVTRAHDVPPRGVVVGVPARLLNHKGEPSTNDASVRASRPKQAVKAGRTPARRTVVKQVKARSKAQAHKPR